MVRFWWRNVSLNWLWLACKPIDIEILNAVPSCSCSCLVLTCQFQEVVVCPLPGVGLHAGTGGTHTIKTDSKTTLILSHTTQHSSPAARPLSRGLLSRFVVVVAVVKSPHFVIARLSLISPAAGKPNKHSSNTHDSPFSTAPLAVVLGWRTPVCLFIIIFFGQLGCLWLGLNLTVVLGTAKTASSLSTVCRLSLPGHSCD